MIDLWTLTPSKSQERPHDDRLTVRREKDMNNNKTDESAILGGGKGVFAKTSYITIGSKEQPELYGQKEKLRSNFGGKQFIAVPARQGRVPTTYFTKKHDWISDGDVYVDRTRYAESQKDRAKGFLTSDFRRRDEFSNIIRTEQWREQLKQERRFANVALNRLCSTEEDSVTPERPTKESQKDEVFLYDRVFEKRDDQFSGASKTHRDTSNPTLLTKERLLGTLRTTYAMTHQPSQSAEKPAYARKPIIRDTFYRKRNIPFAQV